MLNVSFVFPLTPVSVFSPSIRYPVFTFVVYDPLYISLPFKYYDVLDSLPFSTSNLCSLCAILVISVALSSKYLALFAITNYIAKAAIINTPAIISQFLILDDFSDIILFLA